MIDLNKLVFVSTIDGFKNYSTASFSTSYAGGSIAAGGFAGPFTATTPVANANNVVSQMQVQFSGLDTFYRLLPGQIQTDYPNSGSRLYSVEAFSYQKGGNFVMDAYVINQTGVSQTIPAITFNCIASLFLAPF